MWITQSIELYIAALADYLGANLPQIPGDFDMPSRYDETKSALAPWT